jgi:hypothetical protein
LRDLVEDALALDGVAREVSLLVLHLEQVLPALVCWYRPSSAPSAVSFSGSLS